MSVCRSTSNRKGPGQRRDLLEYPLVLNTGARIQSTFRSQHLNVPGLVRLQEHPQVLINPGMPGSGGSNRGTG